MLLVYPFAFFAVEGVSALKCIRWRKIELKLGAGAAVFLIAVTCLFSGALLVLPPETPNAPLSESINLYLHQIPSSMLQNTVSINDCSDVALAVEWLGSHMNSSDRVLSHRAFYGWETAALNSSQVVLYEYDNPADVAPAVSSQVGGLVYVVWWVSGEGWYGQPSLREDFHSVYVSGRIAVYLYTP